MVVDTIGHKKSEQEESTLECSQHSLASSALWGLTKKLLKGVYAYSG